MCHSSTCPPTPHQSLSSAAGTGFRTELNRGQGEHCDQGWPQIVSAYSTAISLVFTIIVTILFSTQGSLDCDVVSGENSQIKKLIHVDFLNLDKSLNGGDIDGEKITKQEGSGDETEHVVICDCGSKSYLPFLLVSVG